MVFKKRFSSEGYIFFFCISFMSRKLEFLKYFVNERNGIRFGGGGMGI